jgi:type VI secretion system protein ImpE
MPAQDTLREGKIDEALLELQQEIRRRPADAKLRVFLFQLLAVRGDWERALVQLNTSAQIEPANLLMAQMYREALQCEVLRSEVFAGKRSPLVFGDPPAWIGWLIEALRLTAQGEHAAAARLREQAFDAAPATAGAVDGRPFAWLADADSRLGPVIEAVVSGRYFWIPLERVRSIKFEAPTDLRDMVWMPATFTWSNEGEAVGLVPTRYPGSESSNDGAIRLARKTEWSQPIEGTNLGVGQRMLATDDCDYPLLDIRQIELGPAEQAYG